MTSIPADDPALLNALLADVAPATLALFLDIDGALAPIAPRPDLARVPAAVRTLVQPRMSTAQLYGRAIVSARTRATACAGSSPASTRSFARLTMAYRRRPTRSGSG